MGNKQSITLQERFARLAKDGVADSFFNCNYTEMRYTVVGYEFLKEIYSRAGHTLSTDDKFCSMFSRFYAMTPLFASKDFIEIFYKKMDEIREMESVDGLDAVEIASELYDATYEKNNDAKRKNFQFSFVTKMLNLADDTKYPIYDSMVASMCGLKALPTDLEDKKNTYGEWYKKIVDIYNGLLKEEKTLQVLARFKKMFHCNDMSDFRALDIIIWEMGKEEKIERIFMDNKTTVEEKEAKLRKMKLSDSEIEKFKKNICLMYAGVINLTDHVGRCLWCTIR